MEETTITDLLGKTIIEVIGGVQDGELLFLTDCGWTYKMYHEQDCCESVYVEDITGDMEDIIGSPIRQAEESSQENTHASESGTWTFYKLNSQKYRGGVCIRWNGESNGYYSEGVNIVKYLTGVV